MYCGIIQKNNQKYFLGPYKNKDDIENMILISESFYNKNDFCKWYPQRNKIYDWMVYKCKIINIPCKEIIQAIYDGYYGEIYNDISALEEFIDDFKIGYEI